MSRPATGRQPPRSRRALRLRGLLQMRLDELDEEKSPPPFREIRYVAVDDEGRELTAP